MTNSARTGAVLGLGVALTALMLASEARAQPRNGAGQHPVAIPGGGTELFRAFLDREGIQPVRANELWFDEDTIVIVIGSTEQVGNSPLECARTAISRNGAALIATDSRTLLFESDKVANFGNPITQITGEPVTADADDCYQPELPVHHTDTPFVVPVSPEERGRGAGAKTGRVWSLFRGLTKLATDDPSYLEEPRRYHAEYQHALARLPRSSQLWGGKRFNSPPLFAIGGDGEPTFPGEAAYSFLVVADASIYINQMIMEQPGTDNFEFMLRTIEYLQGPGKHRKRCLFFENGRIVDRFDGLRAALAKPKPKVSADGMPDWGPLFGKHQDKFIKTLDEMVDHRQTHDWAHRKYIGPPGSETENRTFARVIGVIAIAIAVAMGLFLLRRTLTARHPLDVPPAPITGAGAASTGPPGVFDRRQRELVRRNNLYEPVRNLMREFFDAIGAPPDAGPRMPRLVIDRRAVRKPDSLHQAVRDMWRIAYGPPMHISAQRWFELEPYFNRLRRAHEDGKWRFADTEVDTD
jgi:hypothetical protein